MKKHLPYLLALATAAIVTVRITITCIQHDMPTMATLSITLGMFISLKLGAEQAIAIAQSAVRHASKEAQR